MHSPSCAAAPARSSTRTSSPRSSSCWPRAGWPRPPDALELGLDPVHHRAQLLALALDLVVGLLLAHAPEVLLAGPVLGDPLARERAGLDLAQDLLHRRPRRLGDDALPARHVAVLGRVGDRIAHAADPLLVHEVDDQLELVQALEVRELGVVAGVDERLVARAHELRDAAAQDGLLAEQVGLGLVLEGGLDDAAARAADALGVGEHEVE